jgi:hypothetical protein
MTIVDSLLHYGPSKRRVVRDQWPDRIPRLIRNAQQQCHRQTDRAIARPGSEIGLH